MKNFDLREGVVGKILRNKKGETFARRRGGRFAGTKKETQEGIGCDTALPSGRQWARGNGGCIELKEERGSRCNSLNIGLLRDVQKGFPDGGGVDTHRERKKNRGRWHSTKKVEEGASTAPGRITKNS